MRDDRRRNPPRDWGGPRGAPQSGSPSPSGPRRNGHHGLPQGYLEGGYFNTEGYLKAEYITDFSKEIAEQLASTKLSPTALRRFFNKVRLIEQRWGNNFAAAHGQVLELKPFAQYALTKGTIPPLLKEFIDRNVNAIQDDKDFREGFVKHFQYVVAYFPRGQ